MSGRIITQCYADATRTREISANSVRTKLALISRMFHFLQRLLAGSATPIVRVSLEKQFSASLRLCDTEEIQRDGFMPAPEIGDGRVQDARAGTPTYTHTTHSDKSATPR